MLQVYTPRFKDVGFPYQHLSSDHYGAVYTTGAQPLDATAKPVPTGAALPPVLPPDLLPPPFRPAKAKAGEAPAAVCRALPQEHVSGKRARPTCAREEGRGPQGCYCSCLAPVTGALAGVGWLTWDAGKPDHDRHTTTPLHADDASPG